MQGNRSTEKQHHQCHCLALSLRRTDTNSIKWCEECGGTRIRWHSAAYSSSDCKVKALLKEQDTKSKHNVTTYKERKFENMKCEKTTFELKNQTGSLAGGSRDLVQQQQQPGIRKYQSSSKDHTPVPWSFQSNCSAADKRLRNSYSTTTQQPQKCERKWSPSSSSFYMWKKKTSLKNSSPTAAIRDTTTSSPAERYKIIGTSNSYSEFSEWWDDSINGELDRYQSETAMLADLYCEAYSQAESQLLPCETFPLLQLPNELICIILSNLGFSDLNACRIVCRRLHCLVADSVKDLGVTLSGLITCYTLKRCRESSPSALTFKKSWFNSNVSIMDVTTTASALGNRLKKFTIGTCDFGSIGADTVLHLFTVYCQNITFLKLEWITISGGMFLKAIKKLTKLEALYLINVNGISWQDWKGVLHSLYQQQSDCKLKVLCVKLRPELPLLQVLSQDYALDSIESIICRQTMTKVSEGEVRTLLLGAPNIKEIKIDCIEMTKEANNMLAKFNLHK